MSIKTVADTHVHLYPQFNLHELFSRAYKNLDFKLGATRRILFLTERSSESAFRDLPNLLSSQKPERESDPTWKAEQYQQGILKVVSSQGNEIFVVAGRQIVTREKIEVLALAATRSVNDGLLLEDTITSVLSEGAVAVLPWSPGKWTGERKRKIAEIAQKYGKRLIAGDIVMRPTHWRLPWLYSQIGVLAGSDPLPMVGEERLVGSYAVAGMMEEALSLEACRKFLQGAELFVYGGGLPLPQIALRMLRWEIVRRIRKS